MSSTMQQEFIRQYSHSFRVFERIVQEFTVEAWNNLGRKQYSPARISYHILHSIKYYLEDISVILLESKKGFEIDWENAPAKDLLSQADIIYCIHELHERTKNWLLGLEYDQKNTSFEWAGETRLGVVIFSLRHFLYHLGELSCLLNESKNGDIDDIYVSV